mgnify:FL=1
MIDEKLTDKIGPSVEEQMLKTLGKIESHLKALVFYSTPERAFISSAGKAQPQTQPAPEPIDEIVAQEVEKYLKENK